MTPPAFAASPSDSPLPRALARVDLSVDAVLDADALRATLIDARPETREVFGHLALPERTRLAEDAWFLGLRCVVSAHRAAAESRLEDVGHALVGTFEKQLAALQSQQQAALARMIGDYFDPQSGRVPARLDELLRDDGLLARTLGAYLAPDGELAKVLARAVGENSPVMQRLSPTETQGVVQMVEARVRAALSDGSSQLARTLDPTLENSAIRRFLVQLRDEMSKVDDDRSKQLAVVTKALDPNDATSAMSRLVRESEQASRAFMRALNGDDPTSALGGIKAALVTLVEKHGQAQSDALAALAEQHHRDALETRAAIAKLEERRRQEASSPRGGQTFEAAVGDVLGTCLRNSPVVLDATGGRAGLKPHCKVGDFVATYTEESRYAGSSVVIEAKHDRAYAVAQARAELEEARANRGASVGLFVMARSHAPAGFPTFSRHGQDILVVWDASDASSDPIVWCGLSLALALAARVQRPHDDADLQALRKIEARIGKEVDRLEAMRKRAERIRDDADTLLEDVRKGSKSLTAILHDAKKTLVALDVDLEEEGAAQGEPVSLAQLDPAAA